MFAKSGALRWAGVILFSLAAGSADASICRPLEMRLMQLQAAGARDTAQIEDVRSLLAQRGCGGRAPAAASGRQGSSFAAWDRGRGWGAPGEARRAGPDRRWNDAGSARKSAPRGTFRTLCVRTCDGYYFPISFSTTRKHFESDEATCRRMCPAGNPNLYYHAVGGQGPENMLGLDGSPYTDLFTAFRYRSVLDTGCSCGVQSGVLEYVAGPAVVPNVAQNSVARLPEPRPAPGEDPETLLDRRGGFTASTAEALAAAAGAAPAEGGVRIILPAWNAAQSSVMLTGVPTARIYPD